MTLSGRHMQIPCLKSQQVVSTTAAEWLNAWPLRIIQAYRAPWLARPILWRRVLLKLGDRLSDDAWFVEVSPVA